MATFKEIQSFRKTTDDKNCRNCKHRDFSNGKKLCGLGLFRLDKDFKLNEVVCNEHQK